MPLTAALRKRLAPTLAESLAYGWIVSELLNGWPDSEMRTDDGWANAAEAEARTAQAKSFCLTRFELNEMFSFFMRSFPFLFVVMVWCVSLPPRGRKFSAKHRPLKSLGGTRRIGVNAPGEVFANC